jgi:4-amino-4-deoxy-L-arabinose transferase-like glycosyltransferase
MSPNTPAENRAPSPFASASAIIAYLALARMVLYCLAGPHYGYFRDELYYLACGEHPAWGYVDQPPLIAWITWLLQHTIGTSLWALRLLPALASAATVILAGLLACELGGRRWAIFLASLAALMAPVSLAMSQLFTMNAFDPPLWTAIAFLLIRIAKTGRQSLWLAVGALAGIAILNKYGILFWILGIALGLCLTPQHQSLRHCWFWLGSALAAAISPPNFLWQWQHQFPFLQLMHNIRQGNRDISLPPLPYLLAQTQMLGFVTAILVPFALLFFFSPRGRAYRSLAWANLAFLAEMMFLHGKMYYAAPVYPALFAAGSV